MKIRFTTVHHGFAAGPGDVKEVADDVAAKQIAAGNAEPVELGDTGQDAVIDALITAALSKPPEPIAREAVDPGRETDPPGDVPA